jgi:hypothetical protein
MTSVAIMTMLFLPASFFAALFTVPLLQWGQPVVMHTRFWVYWAFTLLYGWRPRLLRDLVLRS